MIEVRVVFTEDVLKNPNAVPRYRYPHRGKVGLFERIAERTGDEELAQSVVDWAKKAEVGSLYEHEAFTASLVKKSRY